MAFIDAYLPLLMDGSADGAPYMGKFSVVATSDGYIHYLNQYGYLLTYDTNHKGYLIGDGESAGIFVYGIEMPGFQDEIVISFASGHTFYNTVNGAIVNVSSASLFSGNDEIHGSDYKDVIFGYAGDDIAIGYGGDDDLWGDDGHDLLGGGFGNDRLWGA